MFRLKPERSVAFMTTAEREWEIKRERENGCFERNVFNLDNVNVFERNESLILIMTGG